MGGCAGLGSMGLTLCCAIMQISVIYVRNFQIIIILLIFKDRQQEVKAVLVASRYIGDYYMPLEVQYMRYIPLFTLLQGLFIDIKYLEFTCTDTKQT